MKQNIIIYLQEEHNIEDKNLLRELQDLLISNFSDDDYSAALSRLLKGKKVIYVGQMFLEGSHSNYIIMSYPKYLSLSVDLHQYTISGQEIPCEYQDAIEVVKKELYLVCQVIEVANKSIYDDYGDFSPHNRKNYSKEVTQISVAEYLLKDYVQNGKYIFTELLECVNGSGPVNWMATINKCSPLIQSNRIIYTDFIHNSEEENNQSYIYIAYVNAIISAYKLFGEILGFSHIDIPDIDANDFNDVQAVKYLKGYLAQMFDGRGYMVIKTLCAWYELKSEFRVSYCGTNCFDRVWEVVCQKVFCNNEELWQGKMMLPRWTMVLNNNLESYMKGDAITLLPDITCTFDNNFLILDAKYYTPSFRENHKCDGVPATSDVTKQINYYEQLRAFYGDIYQYLNAFLIPLFANSEDWLLQYAGYIKLEHAYELINRIDDGDYSVPNESVDEQDVRVFYINTTKVFKEFLEGTEYFEKIVDSIMSATVSETYY